MSDAEVQAEFAKNPRAVLERYGCRCPGYAATGQHLTARNSKERIGQVKQGLDDQHTTIEEVASGGSSAVTKFVEQAMSLARKKSKRWSPCRRSSRRTSRRSRWGAWPALPSDGTWAVVGVVVVALG